MSHQRRRKPNLITTGVMTTKGKEVAQAQAYTPSEHEVAYNRALEEINGEKIQEIKMVAKTILQQMQKYKEQKEEAEEAMRLLKLDLEDLREGKIDKIRERHEKSQKAAVYSPINVPSRWTWITPYAMNDEWWDINVGKAEASLMSLHNKLWNDLTSGTYTITTRNGTREFYL